MMTYHTPVLVWLLLLALLAASVTAVILAPGTMAHVISLGCAFGMAALILATFMGLQTADGMLRLFALGGLLWLAFLVSLTLADTLVR